VNTAQQVTRISTLAVSNKTRLKISKVSFADATEILYLCRLHVCNSSAWNGKNHKEDMQIIVINGE